MKKCFGYLRVSTVKQGKGVSLVAQKKAILLFAAQNNIIIAKWFKEKRTAAKKGRPVFNAMMKKLKLGKAEGVVIHRIDRSSRNFFDWAKLGELSDTGVDVYFATESLDFRSRGGRLVANVQMAVAEDYIRVLRENTTNGQRCRLEQGLFPFNAPIGYLDNGKGKLKTPDPTRAPLIQLAFDLYAGGEYSLRTLQEKMDTEGLRNRGGKPLSVHGIETMLANPFYCGIMKVKTTGDVYEGKHEPLVSVATFKTVQGVRSGRCGKKVTRHNHTYRGLFRCANCNAAMVPERQRGHIYYRCQTRQCPTKTVREERIENAVSDIFKRFRMHERDVEWLCAEVRRWIGKRSSGGDVRSLSLRLSDLSSRMRKLENAAINEIIDADGFNERKQALLLEKVALEKKHLELTKNQLKPHRLQQFLEHLKSLAATYISAKPERKRELVKLFTSNRTVLGKNVCIEPVDWLLETKNALSVSFGDPPRHTNRRRSKLRDEQLEALAKIAASDHWV